MSTPQKKTFTKVMTEAGVLVWPKINAPDEYKGKKSYSAKIRLSPADSKALIAQIEAELAKFWPIAEAELQEKVDNAKTGPEKAKAKKALAEMAEAEKSYKPAYDDEGNETGEYEFNFKMPDSFVKYKGKPNEEIVYIKPDVFDAAGKQLKVVPEVWGGTTACVAGEFRPYSMPIGVGISLRLKAVQILELRQGGEGGRDAASYGFGKQEGYEAGDDEPSGGFQNRSTGTEPDGRPAPPADNDDF